MRRRGAAAAGIPSSATTHASMQYDNPKERGVVRPLKDTLKWHNLGSFTHRVTMKHGSTGLRYHDGEIVGSQAGRKYDASSPELSSLHRTCSARVLCIWAPTPHFIYSPSLQVHHASRHAGSFHVQRDFLMPMTRHLHVTKRR